MRIYYPDEEALQGLRGSGIELIMDVAKETLPSLANATAARDWVNKYVTPYARDVNFKYIAVGNEIDPNTNEAQYIVPAMTNIQNEISSVNLQGQIKVSTTIYSAVIVAPTYPPNTAVFKSDVEPYIKPIINFLVNNEVPLLANVYLYFSYQQNIELEYALFTQNGINGVGYQNLFDVMLDSKYAKIIVYESGWPSEGGDGASIENARTYYSNLINVSSGNGTPKRHGGPIETYLFAMFDENQK